jgi:hypothetical protein
MFRWSLQPRDRWYLLTLLAAIGAALAIAMAVAGLPPVELNGPLHNFSIMDPLCGGTRAVRLAARGQWVESWRYNPIGVPLVAGAALLLMRAGVGLATRRWLTIDLHLTRVRLRAAGVIAVLLLIALELNQQAHAELLLTRG